MKVVQTWTKNTPTSIDGYSITISYIYSSFDPWEIDEIEKKLPKGIIIMDTDKPQRQYPREEIK